MKPGHRDRSRNDSTGSFRRLGHLILWSGIPSELIRIPEGFVRILRGLSGISAGSVRGRLGSACIRTGSITILAGTLLLLPIDLGAQIRGTGTAGERVITLEESIALGLEHSRSVTDARLALETAGQQVAEARGRALPTLTGNLRLTRSLTPLESFLPARIFDPGAPEDEFITVRFGADNNWNGGLTLDQPLFDYTVIIGLQVVGTARQLAVETLRGTAQRTATDIRTAYYGVLLARESHRLTENSVQRLRQTLTETRARQQAGLASDYDVLRLEVELGNLEPQLRRSADALEAAERNLALLMGLEVETPLRVAGSLMDLDMENRTAGSPASESLLQVAGLPQASTLGYEVVLTGAYTERSDLRQLRINRELAHARMRASRSQYYPTLSGFYSWTVTAQENDRLDFFGENPDYRTSLQQAGVALRVPLFNGFRTRAAVQQNLLGIERVDTGLELLLAATANEVRALVNSLEETRERARAQARSVEQARTGFEIVSARYREGVASRLEVVDAENALRMAEFNYAQAVYDHLVAQAELDLAAGRVPLVDEVSR